MPDQDDVADQLISGKLKKSKSYHHDYGKMSYREILDLATADPSDRKARQMKKLIEQADRLRNKLRRREA